MCRFRAFALSRIFHGTLVVPSKDMLALTSAMEVLAVLHRTHGKLSLRDLHQPFGDLGYVHVLDLGKGSAGDSLVVVDFPAIEGGGEILGQTRISCEPG